MSTTRSTTPTRSPRPRPSSSLKQGLQCQGGASVPPSLSGDPVTMSVRTRLTSVADATACWRDGDGVPPGGNRRPDAHQRSGADQLGGGILLQGANQGLCPGVRPGHPPALLCLHGPAAVGPLPGLGSGLAEGVVQGLAGAGGPWILALSALAWTHLVLWWEVPTTLWTMPGLRRLPYWLLFPLLLALALAYPVAWCWTRLDRRWKAIPLLGGWLCLWSLVPQLPEWLPRWHSPVKGGVGSNPGAADRPGWPALRRRP